MADQAVAACLLGGFIMLNESVLKDIKTAQNRLLAVLQNAQLLSSDQFKQAMLEDFSEYKKDNRKSYEILSQRVYDFFNVLIKEIDTNATSIAEEANVINSDPYEKPN
jgi:hypothetical protein